MPTTLNHQPITEADDEPSDVSTSTTSPFVDPPATDRSMVTVWTTPPIKTSPTSGGGVDDGRYITPTVAALLALGAVGSLIVGAAGWADVTPFPIIASAVLVVFTGLFARVHFGGGKRAALVGALLLPVVAVCATAAPYLDDGVGDRSYHPTSFDDVESEYRYGIGNLDVDLRDVEFPPGEHVITIEHGIGAARVHLPADVSYSASGDVAIGKLDLLGHSDDGINTTIDAETEDLGVATIVLDFDTSIGYGSVERD